MDFAIENIIDSMVSRTLREVHFKEQVIGSLNHKNRRLFLRGRELAKKINIPVEHSYTLLVNLEQNGLILRLRKYPSTFIMTDKGRQVLDLLDDLGEVIK